MIIPPVNHVVEFSFDAVKSMRMIDVEGAVLFENGRVGVELPVDVLELLVDTGKLSVDVLKPSLDVLEAPRDHRGQLIEGNAPGHDGVMISAAAAPVNRERARAKNAEAGHSV
ncbi:MAG TPA: hypothetical protein VGX97_10225 [bacterium]|nr:hypothetical protein [bacterium]